jgi:glutaredoxin 3
MAQITVFTTEPCSFCTRLKGLLTSNGLRFSEVNLSRDPEGRVALVHKTGMMTFPQVVVDGRAIGGFAEIQAAADSGRLRELLEA